MLATNQTLDYLEDQEELLKTYKEQHSVERGFRFIKDPNIVASSFFVQKPERVAALLFVMTTCLLVYSALEYRIRQNLKKENKTIPDQKGKPAQNPTARWVFLAFCRHPCPDITRWEKFDLKPQRRAPEYSRSALLLEFLFLIFERRGAEDAILVEKKVEGEKKAR